MFVLLSSPALVSGLLLWISQRLLIFTVLLTAAYAAGWIHRLIWYIAEREACKLLNGTKVTAGSIELDVLRNRYWASNVIIHAPCQETWHWEAPVLARVGKVYVEVNLVQCLLSLWLLWEETPLELYTIQMSDIQVFVERKHNIYNFFLLDPHVILPDPPPTDDADDLVEAQQQQVERRRRNQASPEANPPPEASSMASRSTTANTSSPSALLKSVAVDDNVQEAERAQQVVDDMMNAVRRAANSGDNWQGTLLNDCRASLTDQLRVLTTKKKSVVMQEGVNILKHVSKSITEKTAAAQQVVLPARRDLPGERPVYGRVGRVLIQDARIFLRDNTNTTNTNIDSTIIDEKKEMDDSSANKPSAVSWNKPIVIQKVAIRATEFCPPTAAKDQMLAGNAEIYDPNLPALYQSLDVCLEVIWKRVLAEIAKSNTGRFFQTAMGEVADVFSNNKLQQQQQQHAAETDGQRRRNSTS